MSQEKKVIVTAAGPNMNNLLIKYSLPTFTRYAEAQGYSIDVTKLPQDSMERKDEEAKKSRWQKISLIRKALRNNDIAVWFDADIMITSTVEDIADHVGANDYQGLVLHSVPAENRLNPNTGVWVAKNCNKMFQFLDEVESIGIPDGRWADQAAVMLALGWNMGDQLYHGAQPPSEATEFTSGTTWLPTGWNQPYTSNRSNPEAYIGRPLVAKPHAVHFMAMTIGERTHAMQLFAEQNNETSL